MAPFSSTTSNFSFTPRVDLESDALKKRLDSSEYDPTACAEIEEMLSLLGKDRQDCVSVLAHLQAQVEALSSHLRQVQECESKLRPLLSPTPILQLPNELLMFIFDDVSQDNLLREHPRLKKSPLWQDGEDGLATMPALALSSVCSRWRRILLSESALWSQMSLILYVDITEESSAVLQSGGFFNIVQLYIERSAVSPLQLR
ncbi:hypothetical protein BT96DRAFT_1014795 [Gymnopus androsaceus JB14]|uniref:F-box domain-containing protein n=1 Tax=Gymnopus androsaceus JB14 TaxID=1447944 RepID=A0A6A4ICT6_9AGAR|nr:hypothetical protein BT96DRAFT_1014795 [Gymnopus androsaceus JB14]